MNFLRLCILLVLVALAGCATKQNPYALDKQTYAAEDTSRTIDLTHPPRDMWDRIRRGFAIPNLHDDRVDYWTNYYASHPESVLLMSQRAGKYLYYIVDELNRRGLPTELALLPFVESAYDPNAYSRSHASGLWQFIPSTGQQYNLEQDWWRDQRRDPVASTNAALDYLTYLYDFQGDWYLARASYNWGEGSVNRAMEKNVNDGELPIYTALKMPDETRNYVPKLQAIKNIIARPERFGISLPKVSNTPYFTTVAKTQDMDIQVAAALAEMPIEDFKALNPSYRRPIIRGSLQAALHLPLDKVEVFNANLDAYTGRLSSWRVYQPKRGQSLASIAQQHGVSLQELRRANNLSAKASRATASALLIPTQDTGVRLASYDPDASAAHAVPAVADDAAENSMLPQANVRTHTIHRGDTLYSLARRYKTSVNELRKLNNLKGNKLSTGKRLRVPGTNIRG
jgi:membrane-bound lytic murein transglycosylase D